MTRYETDQDGMVQLWTEQEAREEWQNDGSAGWQVDIRAGTFALGHTKSEAVQTARTFDRGETVYIDSTKSDAYMQARDVSVPEGAPSGASETAAVVVNYQGFSITIGSRSDETTVSNVGQFTAYHEQATGVFSETLTINTGATTNPSAGPPAPGKASVFRADPSNTGNVYVAEYPLSPGETVSYHLTDPSNVSITSDNDGESVSVTYEVNN